MKKFADIKSYLIYFILFFSILTINSCTKNYEKINTDKNTVAEVGEAQLPLLFAKAVESVPWNDQTPQNLYSDQYAQYFANNTTYFPTDRYTIDMDWLSDPWNSQYTKVVPQLKALFENTDSISAEYALVKIWWVYSFHRITDYWGPIPYFNAGVPGTSVAYDSQKDIYDDFFKKLDNAVTVLKGKTGETPYGLGDPMYGGNINKWIKFANTLRLRLAMRLSKVDPTRAKKEAELAVQSGVMEASPNDDAYVKKNSLDQNPLSVMATYKHEFSMSAAMESVLKGYQDPRISEYFTPAVATGTFEGIRNGLEPDQVQAPINAKNMLSWAGPRWSTPDQGGPSDYLSTPSNVMFTAEAYFLRAEGALLGWNMIGTPEELYKAGIRNSMLQWGITNESLINTYVSSTATPIAPDDYLNSPPLSNVPIKFDMADKNMQLKQIAMQKWIALYPDGWEAWADYRRRPVVHLYPVANSDNPDISDPSTQYIRRVPFLLQEKQTNGSEMEKAIKLLGGPDKITTPLWWDVN